MIDTLNVARNVPAERLKVLVWSWYFEYLASYLTTILKYSVCIYGHRMLSDGSCSEYRIVTYNLKQRNVKITVDGEKKLKVM